MVRQKRKCIVCWTNDAEVPDRDQGGIGRPIKKVCRECHSKRLARDLECILARHYEKKEGSKNE